MLTAHELKKSAFIRHGGKIFKVLEQTYHMGGGKVGGTVHLKMRDVLSGHVTEIKLGPHEKVEDLEIQRRKMRYLYQDGEGLCFMDPESYEQITLGAGALGHLVAYLREELDVEIEFHEGNPIHVTPPEKVVAEVASTTPPVKGDADSVYKPATLTTGAEVLVPQFIKEGDRILVHVETGKYVDRVKE